MAEGNKSKDRGGIYFRFKNGNPSASVANCRYITRPAAIDSGSESIYLQNYPTFIAAKTYQETRENLLTHNQLSQDYELSRDVPGGQVRTFYAGVMSFEGKIETAKALELAREYLQNQFPLVRAIAVVHQDTKHTHVHFHLQATNINFSKIQLKTGNFKALDEGWAKICGREFGIEKEREHLEKKRETREYRWAMARGEDRNKPDRINWKLKDIFRERERRNRYGPHHKGRIGRDQRSITGRHNRVEQRISKHRSRGFGTSRREQRVERSVNTIRIRTRTSDGLQRQVNRAGGTIDKRERRFSNVHRSVDRTERKISSANRSFDNAKRTISRAIISTERKVNNTNRSFDNTKRTINRAISNTGRTTDSTERTVDNTKRTISRTVEGRERTIDIAKDAVRTTRVLREATDRQDQQHRTSIDRLQRATQQVDGTERKSGKTLQLVRGVVREFQDNRQRTLSRKIDRSTDRDYPDR